MHLVGNVCFKKRLVGITKGIGSGMLKTAIVFFIFNEPLKKRNLVNAVSNGRIPGSE